MSTSNKLAVQHLSKTFLDSFLECCLVKSYITPTSGNTQIGHNLWKSGYRDALHKYISQHLDKFHELPSNIHLVESPSVSSVLDKNIVNIVKFPNIPPYVIIKNGKASLLNEYPHESDSGCFGFKNKEWLSSSTSLRSLGFLRSQLYWPHRAPLEFFHRFQQQTNISNLSLYYLCQLVLTFTKVHRFPPNLAIIRNVINALPSHRKQYERASELLDVINTIDLESRAEGDSQRYSHRLNQKNDSQSVANQPNTHTGWRNHLLIPDQETYLAMFRSASLESPKDVFELSYPDYQAS